MFALLVTVILPLVFAVKLFLTVGGWFNAYH
jgi:hypothetical protein